MIVNFGLMKHPINWLVVLLMLVIAGAAGHLILTYLGKNPAGPEVPMTAGTPERTTIAEANLAQ